MTVVRINAITVPADSGDELARRFAARAGAVDNQDGFEGFELLKPTDGRTTWLVVTRWRDEAAFQAWVSSPAFAHGHRSAAERAALGCDDGDLPVRGGAERLRDRVQRRWVGATGRPSDVAVRSQRSRLVADRSASREPVGAVVPGGHGPAAPHR